MFNPKSKIALPNPTSVTAQQLQTLKTASGQPRQGSQSPNPVVRGGSQTFPQHVSGVTAILRKSSDVSTKTTITFQRPPNDGLYVDSSVYVSGYQGNPQPVKVASGQSPISFPLNNTGESLAFTVQANGPTGSAPLSSAPTTTSKLVSTPLATVPTTTGTGAGVTPYTSPNHQWINAVTGVGYLSSQPSFTDIAGPLNNIVLADQQTGSDWGAKVNAASTLLSGGGEIWVSTAAGTSAPAANITLLANQVLRFTQGGTWALGAKQILLGAGSGIVGVGKNGVTITATGNQSVISPSNSTNNLTRYCTLKGFTISATTSTGIGLDLLNANSWLVEDFHVTGFTGAGGTGIRIRGAGTTSGAYFNRFYNGFIDNAATAVLISYDVVGNIPTSYEFDNVHLNVVTNGFDVQGSTGWFRDCYVENVSGIGMRFRSTAINHFLRAVFLDNSGSAGTGTGLQFDSGGSDNRAQVSISGFSTNLSDSGANNHYDGYNTALWKVNANGTFTGYNSADVDYIATVRAGATADQNTVIGYENHDGTKAWYSGQSSGNKFQWLYNSLSSNPALSLDISGNSTFSPSNGADNALSVNLQAGSASDQIENLNFLDKSSTMQWRFRKDASNNFNLFDSNSAPRIGGQPGTNGFSSISGAGTGSTNLAFGGSGGTKFGNGDNSTVVAVMSSTGTLQLSGTAPTVAAGQLGLGASTSGTATAGAATLPANPVGFLVINIAGTNFKVPYYAV